MEIAIHRVPSENQDNLAGTGTTSPRAGTGTTSPRAGTGTTSLGKEVEVSINDNGPGILEANLPFIFNRFWRREKSRARRSGGAGLGLAITNLLVEEQGGQIVARSLSDGGFQVCVSFPAAG